MNWISPRVCTDDTGTFGTLPGARAKAVRVCRHTTGAGRRIQKTRSLDRLQNISAESVLWTLLWATCWAAIAISAFQLL